MKGIWFLFLILPILIGELIYYLKSHGMVSSFMGNYFPDALWMFSFSGLQLIIWRNQKRIVKIFWYLIPLLVSFILELFQKHHLIQGTFDYNDLLTYFIGWILCFSVFSYFNKLTYKTSSK